MLASAAGRSSPLEGNPLWNELTQRFGRIYKRTPYQHHKDHLDILEPVFQWIAEDITAPKPRGSYAMLSAITKIKKTTLSTWKTNLRNDISWRPSRAHYGQHLRIFSPEQEFELVERIRRDYLEPGLFYSDQDFRTDALNFYWEQVFERCKDDPTIVLRVPEFSCSVEFRQLFRERWRYRLRRPNMKRRPQISQEKIVEFNGRVRNALRTYGGDLVFNMDETNYRLVNNHFLTWACRGQRTVSCNVKNDCKEGLTVLAIISKSGRKLINSVVSKAWEQLFADI